ncbi:MAG: hypothetical protein EXS05_19975 [Planctomycetaceae bacterium]|nr:hypothetical protein [Planctomycetaceae bacterium]
MRIEREPMRPAGSVTASLPVEVWAALGYLVCRTSGKKCRAELLAKLQRHCVDQIAAGVAPGELAARFGDPAAVRLFGRRSVCPVALESNLPAPLLRVVAEVVQRTKLWPRERDNVARELCTQFADGVKAGCPTDELIRAFGPIRPAARLIRRGRIPNRPVLWHLWRRAWQGAVGISLAAIVYFGTLIGWLHLAGAPTHIDAVGRFDAEQEKVPIEDRAWPYYRNAIVQFVDLKDPTIANSVAESLVEGPNGAHWAAAREHLKNNQPSLDLLVQGSACREFGLVYRDRENNGWLKQRNAGDVDHTWPQNRAYSEVRLPQIQELQQLSRLLQGAEHRAIEDGDGKAATRYLVARLRLAQQIWNSAEFPIIENMAAFQLLQAHEAVTRLAALWPELLSDADLVALSAVLVESGERGFRPKTQILRDQILGTIAGFFSNDGSGDGHLSAEGVPELQDWISMAPTAMPELAGWQSWLRGFPEGPWRERLSLELSGAILATMVGDRRETLGEAQRLLDLYEADIERDYWDLAESGVDDELTLIKDDPELRHRYLPVLMTFHVMGFSVSRSRAAQMQTTSDTALLAVTLEQYRRRHGTWPARLDELVTEFIDVVPRDQHDGKPLRYILTGSGPLVYSVSADRTDDTGAAPWNEASKPTAATGNCCRRNDSNQEGTSRSVRKASRRLAQRRSR